MAQNDLTKMRLHSGLGINLEFPGDDKRHTSTLIGFVPQRYVLVNTPLVGEDRALLVRMDQPVVCRFFAHKAACAFQSQITYICTTPMHYLHLTWPAQVEVGAIRKSERVDANLQVSAINQSDMSWDRSFGAIVDLSITGARLETAEPVGRIGDTIALSGRVIVGHVTRLITIEAEICAELTRFELSNSTAAYGIEFKYISDIDFLAIQAFVNGQIAKGA